MLDEERSDVTFEPPDVVHIRLVGSLDEAKAVRLTRTMASFSASAPSGILAVVNVRGAGSIPPDARRAAVKASKDAAIRAVAIVGATFTTRVVLTLIQKGAQVMLGRSHPMRFFDDESEARKWLEERRAPAEDPGARRS
jgi:hypothetical protein